MLINIVDEVCKKLGIAELQKIDPNTQEVKKPENITPQNYLWQAAIPAVLLGLYKFSGNKDGNAAVISGSFSSGLLFQIFGNNSESVISRVGEYTGNTNEYVAEKMEIVAYQSINVIKENITDKEKDNAVRQFLIDQRNNILLYLPAELQLGNVLNDNSIDDRTNKMEGR